MKTTSSRNAQGFSLIEVMIAVVILSFGLLALAALQGSLFRAGADSKARANATAIAQQVVENAKTFAFVSSPPGYTGSTYQSLATAELDAYEVDGMTFSVCREVRRFQFDDDPLVARFVQMNDVTDACADTGVGAVAFSPATPEFKEIRVSVSWAGGDGVAKSVELTDSVAAISPADSVQVVKAPSDATRGPEMWTDPPNKGDPTVVPIGIGGDQSAASSNPTPEQFVDDVSSVTLFSVMTFTGDTAGDEVRLNRKVEVAAVSCVCEAGPLSSATNPVYQATQWNGKQLAYMEPQPLPAGTRTGVPIVSSSDSSIETMCTVCCRDHHQTENRLPPPDPYRLFASSEAEHHGYKYGQGKYQVLGGLFPLGNDTGGRYVEACQLVRVGGLMRLAVDAQQNSLLITPVTTTGYSVPGFVGLYSGFVSDTITDGMASLPTAYPGPGARFPAPTSARLTEYEAIVTPAAIALEDVDTRKLVAFGLYVDYLNADTIEAYKCALPPKSNEGDCAGLGDRNPLEVLPLYAVNVANVGSWVSAKPTVASVANATYKTGLLVSNGGATTAGSSSSTTEFPVTLKINNSNSGLAGTFPIDPDDKDAANFVSDAQSFTKSSGPAAPDRNNLFIHVNQTSMLTLANFIVTSPAGGTQCEFDKKTNITTCSFDSPATLLEVGFANYTTEAKVGGQTVITDRKICVANDSRLTGPTVTNPGQVTETTVLTLSNLAALDYTLTINIFDEGTPCPTGTASLAP